MSIHDNSTKTAPVNTAAMAQENSLAMLAEAFTSGSPNEFIERQEAQGQRSFTQSDTLPVDIQNGNKEALEKSGLKFLGTVPGDKLFQYVELPEGWEKQATAHSMWSDLLDDKGRQRASIFYKATNDRSAHMSLKRRYNVEVSYETQDRFAVCLDGHTQIYKTEVVVCSEEMLAFDVSEKAKELAEAWMDNNYPQWRDPSAYWD